MIQSANSPRLSWLDALRGAAILAMIAYHFGFDLSYFSVVDADFHASPILRALRVPIVAMFLWISGMSLLLAYRKNLAPTGKTKLPAACLGIKTFPQHLLKSSFWRRNTTLFFCALCVSLASYALFPQTWIYFGVLHCILISTFLAQPFLARPRWALVAGCAIILVGLTIEHPFFNARVFSWLGLVTELPTTEDFVPLFPWFGVVLLGVATFDFYDARQSARVNHLNKNLVVRNTHSLSRFIAPLVSRLWGLLRGMGRHSLLIYMIHQPILLFVVWLCWGRQQ